MSGASKILEGFHSDLYPYFFLLEISVKTLLSKHKDDQPDDAAAADTRAGDATLPKWDTEFLKVDQGTLFGSWYSYTEKFRIFRNYRCCQLPRHSETSRLCLHHCCRSDKGQES